MKKLLLILFILPLFAFGQIPPGANFLIPADTGATLPRLATGHDIRGWTWSNDTLHSPYNVWLDSSFMMGYNGWYFGYPLFHYVDDGEGGFNIEGYMGDMFVGIGYSAEEEDILFKIGFENGDDLDEEPYQAILGMTRYDTITYFVTNVKTGELPNCRMGVEDNENNSIIILYSDSLDIEVLKIVWNDGSTSVLWEFVNDTLCAIMGTDTARVCPER